MKLVVISPESEHPRESAVLEQLFAAGLERYHVRKLAWSRAQLEAWLRALPAEWRARLVLHQHHDLVRELGLGGVHFRDAQTGQGVPAEPSRVPSASGADLRTRTHSGTAQPEASPCPQTASCSCHAAESLRAAPGRFDYVFFSPVFASVSKPGHGPSPARRLEEISILLAARTPAQRRTPVLALGGVTAARMPEVRALGFDGAAVLGTVWQAADPVRAFVELQDSLCRHAT